MCPPALMLQGSSLPCCPDTALVPNRAVPGKSAGTTHPSPDSRMHPRSRSGCFGSHSPQCPHGWTHSWGWGRLWGIQLCHCPANPPGTDGIPSRKSIIGLKIALSQVFHPREYSHPLVVPHPTYPQHSRFGHGHKSRPNVTGKTHQPSCFMDVDGATGA